MYDYKSAGVDTHKAQSYIQDLKGAIVDTHKGLAHGKVLDNFGGFAGIFETNGMRLVAATDGVGTKIELSRQFARFGTLETLGQDLTAMCVNDLYCVGAQPLFFLDYIACGKLDDSWYHPVVTGIAAACKHAGIALLGGESAEHPGTMKDGDFDLAGFCVGSLSSDTEPLPKVEAIEPGDILYGAPSSGLHSNGFSLVRKILGGLKEESPERYQELTGNEKWIKEELLAPTTIYTQVPAMLKKVAVKAMAHITGGGFYENLERVMAPQLCAHVDPAKIDTKPIFEFLKEFVAPKDLYSTFNMGVGMVAIASAADEKTIAEYGFTPIGKIDAKGESGAAVVVAGI